MIRPTLHKIAPDVSKAHVYFRGPHKLGKTTSFVGVSLLKYKDPTRALVINFGNEDGVSMIDDVYSVNCKSWADIEEILEWLVKGKGKEHNIEMVCLDTSDELVRILENQTIREYNLMQKKPEKKVTSINEAFGGFHRGQKHTADNYLSKMLAVLKDNFGVWVIGHTAFKNVSDRQNMDEEGVMRLTSNLDKSYEAVLSYALDVTITGQFVKDIEEVEIKQGNDTIKRRFAKDDYERRLYFRATETIDAGGRFSSTSSVPEYIVMKDEVTTARELTNIIEKAMEESKSRFKGLYNPDDIKVPEPEPVEEKVDLESIINEIRTKYSSASKEAAGKFMEETKKYGKLTDIKDPAILYNLLEILK